MFKALFVYYLFAIIYMIFQFRKNRRQVSVKMMILLFCPFFGMIFLYFMFHQLKSDEYSIPEGMIKREKEQSDILQKIDVEKETSIVPMKDALLLNDNQTKRRMLMNLLKNDTFNHIEILQTALQNDDSETSHYAAAAIQDIKGKLLNAIAQMEFQLEEYPNDLKLLISFGQVIKNYLNTGFLDDRTEKRYRYQYTQILERMIEIDPNEKKYYIEKINCDLDLGELKTAEKYCRIFLDQCSNEEESYFMAMKLYYSMKNQIKFQEVLLLLRQSSVRLTPQGLSKIRFWLHGETNGS
ncbi:PLD nuclease N-terminal domain-containing protein [Cytobacillus massiliigabonensis]|uniref:PLD nuclease N-terminal domain-containing protein n=1 Tax=Cytobacillus massiliigabonensis TaxID=1871011 RepID=UPI000C81FF7D|nr:PLD nuclease N-terminal domain-containing protein [Cytobacillus massiliigabonensis]